MKNRFEVIIFDWDGTLIDSVDWIVHCIHQAAAHYQCTIPSIQATKDIIGLSIENAVNQLFPDVDAETKHHLTTHYSQHFFAKEITVNDLFPGVYEMLQALTTKGYRLAIATGKRSSGLAQAVEATGVGHFFASSRCSDQTASKPDPLMLNEIIAELGVEKQRTLMVGDSIHDLQMALNAGIASVAVSCGANDAKTLQKYQPLMCLSYPTDLLNFI